MKILTCVLAAILFASNSAPARELTFGASLINIGENSDSRAAGLVLEYHTDPFFTGFKGTCSWAGAMEIDEDNDLFVGVGIHASWDLWNRPWSLEGSFSPGYYEPGRFGKDLGGNLQFRTLLSLAYVLNTRDKISISIDHKSNGGIESRNPGEESLAFRYSRRF